MPHFVRQHPPVSPAGDCMGDIQVGEAYDARWVWSVMDSDGVHYIVTIEAALVEDDGRRYVQTCTNYATCEKLSDPGGTERWSDYIYGEADCGLTDADIKAWLLAHRPPTAEEWAEVAHDGMPE